MLYKTLAQPHIDYGALLWYPTGNLGQMGAIEGPLRAFTRRMKGCNELNYWQRLKYTGMNSCERRIERFKILYMWKVIQGYVPSLGFTTQNDSRRGRMIVTDRPTGKVRSVRTLKEKSLQFEGPRIFNSLPKVIRNMNGSLTEFKSVLDMFLALIPDCPIIKGYTTHNYDNNCRQSNSISDWIRSMKLYDWEFDQNPRMTCDAD